MLSASSKVRRAAKPEIVSFGVLDISLGEGTFFEVKETSLCLKS